MKKVLLCFVVFYLFLMGLNAAPLENYSTVSYDQEKPLENKAWKMTAGDCIVYVVFFEDTEKLYIVINDNLAAVDETGVCYPGSVCETSTAFPESGYMVSFTKTKLTRCSLTCTYPSEGKSMSSKLEIIDECSVPSFGM